MKWKPVIISAAAITVGGIAYAGYRYFKKQTGLLDQYEVTPVSISIVKFTKDEGIVKFTIRLTNKSDIEAVMETVHADVYINNVFIGYVVNDTSALIPAKGTSDIKLEATFSPQIILKNLVDILTLSASIKDLSYRLNGYVKLKSGILPVSVPFDDSGKLSDYI